MSLSKSELQKLKDEAEEVALDAMTRRVAAKLGLYGGTKTASVPASMEKFVLLAIKRGYLEGKKDQISRQLEAEKKGKAGQEKVFQELSAKAEGIMKEKDELFARLQRLHRVRAPRIRPADQNKEAARQG